MHLSHPFLHVYTPIQPTYTSQYICNNINVGRAYMNLESPWLNFWCLLSVITAVKRKGMICSLRRNTSVSLYLLFLKNMPLFMLQMLQEHFFFFPLSSCWIYAPLLFLTIFHQEKRHSVTQGHHNLKKIGTWTSWNQNSSVWRYNFPKTDTLSITKWSRG